MVCAPFECLSRNFILPEPANHVYFYAFLEFAQFIVPYLLFGVSWGRFCYNFGSLFIALSTIFG